MTDYWSTFTHAKAVHEGVVSPSEEPTEPPTPEYEEWIKTDEYEAAIELLRVTDGRLRIVSIGASGEATTLYYGPEGFYYITGATGMAAAYSEKKPKAKPVELDDALKFIRKTIKHNPKYSDWIQRRIFVDKQNLVDLLRTLLLEHVEEVEDEVRQREATAAA